MADPAAPPPRARLEGIDLVRGLVMALMALDHARDFLSGDATSPTDMAVTTPALFLTRWVTHFCAPAFVFLAGVSVALQAPRKSPSELSRFLLTRGLWLVVLEATLVRLAWSFRFDPHFAFVQVIWVLGVSMIVLGGLIHLPRAAVAAFGVVMVVGHNLLDRFPTDGHGVGGWLWALLHQSMFLSAPGFNLFVRYPLIPWLGVMAAGYALGGAYAWEPGARRRLLVRLGAGAIVLFIVLRASGLYGDPVPFAPSPRGFVISALAFLNCEKYPPSLLYLLMTLGPAILALGLLDGRPTAALLRPLVVFGRVPLFYYLAHLYLLHGAGVLIGLLRDGPAGAAAFANKMMLGPADWARIGFSLPVVYAMWLAALFVLYWPCRAYARWKGRARGWWWSYL